MFCTKSTSFKFFYTFSCSTQEQGDIISVKIKCWFYQNKILGNGMWGFQSLILFSKSRLNKVQFDFICNVSVNIAPLIKTGWLYIPFYDNNQSYVYHTLIIKIYMVFSHMFEISFIYNSSRSGWHNSCLQDTPTWRNSQRQQTTPNL